MQEEVLRPSRPFCSLTPVTSPRCPQWSLGCSTTAPSPPGPGRHCPSGDPCHTPGPAPGRPSPTPLPAAPDSAQGPLKAAGRQGAPFSVGTQQAGLASPQGWTGSMLLSQQPFTHLPSLQGGLSYSQESQLLGPPPPSRKPLQPQGTRPEVRLRGGADPGLRERWPLALPCLLPAGELRPPPRSPAPAPTKLGASQVLTGWLQESGDLPPLGP